MTKWSKELVKYYSVTQKYEMFVTFGNERLKYAGVLRIICKALNRFQIR